MNLIQQVKEIQQGVEDKEINEVVSLLVSFMTEQQINEVINCLEDLREDEISENS